MDLEKSPAYEQPGKPEETAAEEQEKSPEETEAEAQQEEVREGAPTSRFEKIAGGIKEFWATQIKGEVREKTESEEMAESFAPTGIKVAKAGIPAIAGAMASMFGVKSFIDLPRFLSQKYFTKQEKDGLMEAFERAEEGRKDGEGEKEKDAGDVARGEVGARTAELRGKIEGSKYMTAEKKAELLKKIDEIDAGHSKAIAGADDERKREFAKALEASIETKVKGTTALKETLNTIAVASGLSAARALVFGSVSLFERYQKVSGEMEKGERKGSLFHEMVAKGVEETFMAATFREGHTTGEKIRNASEALASIMRFAGMTAVGVNELNQEGISGAISKAIEGLKTENITDFVSDNFSENTHHLAEFFQMGGGHEEVVEHAGGAAAAVDAGTALSPDAVSVIQEGIHVGESQLEVGAKIQEETSGGHEKKKKTDHE